MEPNLAYDTNKYNISDIIKKFTRTNRMRMEATREHLNAEQRGFVDILPFLFHFNCVDLPGFVSEITPSGISHYSPLQQTLKTIKRFFPKYKHIRRAKHQMDIHALFLMGSAGSVAYSDNSDFDVWLIHSPNLDTSQIDELSHKAKLIEQWADNIKLEVHFFIFDAESFRSGQHLSLSTESSGSTQHNLLLDEFYRSSILIAGRSPIWWLVPPKYDYQYDNYVDLLCDSGLIQKSDYIDLGSSCPIPPSEFFGAAVWQLYKAIQSPYKSVLKLLLMEVYASEYPEIELLSSRFKSLIYENEENLSNLDPYIIMYKVVETYLMTRQDKERLGIFRECFYFKIGEKLSRPKLDKNKTTRRRFLEDMMLEWGWDNSNFSLLDMQNKWRIDDINHHRTNLVNTLTKSYQFLSDFARKNADVYKVNQTELNVLGRKLYAAFEKKNHKIELINQSSDELYEPEITIQQTVNSDNQIIWNLYRGKINQHELKNYKALKKAKDILDLLVWCHINRVASQHSAILLHSSNHGISTREIKDTFHALHTLFPDGELYKANFNDLSKPAKIISAGVFVNVGIDPLNKSIEDIKHIASSRQDALSYGAKHENLAQSFDFIIHTSWEEVLVYHYNDINGLMRCITDYISWIPDGEIVPSSTLQVFSLSTPYGNNISTRISNLFHNILNEFIVENKERESIRYILESEDQYYIFEYSDSQISNEHVKSIENLEGYLEQPAESFSKVLFDDTNHWPSELPKLYKLNQKSVIQTFYMIENNQAKIIVIDEKGSMFKQYIPYYNTHALITHLNRFYNSILNRKNFMMGEIMEKEIVGIEFYEIVKIKKSSFNVVKVDVKPKLNTDNYFDIQVIGSIDEEEKSHLSVYCNNQEFSSLEYGDNVLSVFAEYVLSKRNSKDPYPIYITDIDFSRNILDAIEPQKLQTVHFLKYKKKIEEKLENAIKNIVT